jgi:hypothetical protein
MAKHNISQEVFNEQLEEFVLYWTEKSPNGKKQRWQKEKTFDPIRRFARWIKQYKERHKPKKYENHINIKSIL